ncbi:hypothetical protein NDU88_005793 [Pleurodeles waltl]|uniref:Secreted protein n=1 Tax=Pleurodeles waltl TaxID=8319 RepID=A0AAV7RN33_PLEWA|nr:hypothetical protein NDU88_005793 [Pleurodeles waltl]
MAVLPLLFSHFSSSTLLLLSSSDCLLAWSFSCLSYKHLCYEHRLPLDPGAAGSPRCQRRIRAASGGPRRAPSSPQARAARRSRSPVFRRRSRPSDAASGLIRVGGPFTAGRAPARKSPAFQGGSGLRLRSLQLLQDLPVSVRNGSPMPSQAPPLCGCGMPRG